MKTYMLVCLIAVLVLPALAEPKARTCTACEGSGKTRYTCSTCSPKYGVCKACRGTGQVLKMEFNRTDRMVGCPKCEGSKKCVRCKGLGKLERICAYCRGTGKLKMASNPGTPKTPEQQRDDAFWERRGQQFTQFLAPSAKTSDTGEALLRDMKLKYSDIENRIRMEKDASVEKAANTYRASLMQYMDKLKKDGNVDGYVIAKRDLDTFNDTGMLPGNSAGRPASVTEAAVVYGNALEDARTVVVRNRETLDQSYKSLLEELKRQLLAEERIDDAVAINSEVKSVNARITNRKKASTTGAKKE